MTISSTSPSHCSKPSSRTIRSKTIGYFSSPNKPWIRFSPTFALRVAAYTILNGTHRIPMTQSEALTYLESEKLWLYWIKASVSAANPRSADTILAEDAALVEGILDEHLER